MTRDFFIPRHGAAYVLLVIASGICVISFSAYDLAARMLTAQWFTLAALTLLSGSATVKLPSVPATISISETFVFTSVLLFGPSAGATIVALDGFIISIWLAKRRKEFYRIAFNMSAPAISIWLAAGVYYSFPQVHPLLGAGTEVAIDKLLVRIGPLILHKCIHLRWVRRQPKQIQAEPSYQSHLVGLWRWFETLLLQSSENEPIDRIANPT